MPLRLKLAIHCHASANAAARYAKRTALDREMKKARSRTSTRIAGKSSTWLYGAYMGTTSTVNAITSAVARPKFSGLADSPRARQRETAQASTAPAARIFPVKAQGNS